MLGILIGMFSWLMVAVGDQRRRMHLDAHHHGRACIVFGCGINIICEKMGEALER